VCLWALAWAFVLGTALPCPALVRRQDLGRQTQRSFTAVFNDRLEKPETNLDILMLFSRMITI